MSEASGTAGAETSWSYSMIELLTELLKQLHENPTSICQLKKTDIDAVPILDRTAFMLTWDVAASMSKLVIVPLAKFPWRVDLLRWQVLSHWLAIEHRQQGDVLCVRELLSRMNKMRIFIGQGSALRPVFIRLEHKRLRANTVFAKENSSKVRLIALQESVKSVSSA